MTDVPASRIVAPPRPGGALLVLFAGGLLGVTAGCAVVDRQAVTRQLDPAGTVQLTGTVRLKRTAPPRVEPAVPLVARFLPAEPRLETVESVVAGEFDENNRPEDLFPDEYLFDGGDRDHPIHYDTYSRYGVDTEDTIAEYVDDTGDRHVKATNRVAIYSPRFSAIRAVSLPTARFQVERVKSAHDDIHELNVRQREVVGDHSQPLPLSGVRVRSRASGLDNEANSAGVEQRLVATDHVKLLNIFQNTRFLESGRFEVADKPVLAASIAAAGGWSTETHPVISASDSAGQQVLRSARLQEYVGIDVEQKTIGRLRIIKLADKRVAKPGDVVTFTIRYDNLGERPLSHIRIVDNLTPRLAYIEDSAVSDRDGRIDLEDNDEGSEVLLFVLDKPLPGNTGGVITFQARVR